MKTLLSHRSIRKYQNRPIEKEILDEILKAVQAAPNWVNLQHIEYSFRISLEHGSWTVPQTL